MVGEKGVTKTLDPTPLNKGVRVDKLLIWVYSGRVRKNLLKEVILKEKDLIKKFDEFEAKHDVLAAKSTSSKWKILKPFIAKRLANLRMSFFNDLCESNGLEPIELSFEPAHCSYKIIISPDGRSIVRTSIIYGYGSSFRETDIVYIFQRAPMNTKIDLRNAIHGFFAKIEELKAIKLKVDEVLEKHTKNTQKK